MKTYIITVARTFPKMHKRAGEQTLFTEKIACAVFCPGNCDECDFQSPKIHTIRSNYELWEKRAQHINEGKAVLSIRYWSGKPYNSKQVELCQLNEVGVQKLQRKNSTLVDNRQYVIDGNTKPGLITVTLAKNDGLGVYDFMDWFPKGIGMEPMAIIHFTEFRY